MTVQKINRITTPKEVDNMKRIAGIGGDFFAKVISEILDELIELPKNGLDFKQRGVILMIAKDNETKEVLSIWKIGEVPDNWLYTCAAIECGERLLVNPSHSNSRQSTPEDNPFGNWGVAIRIKTPSGKRIVCIYGLTEEANEALLVLASIHKEYLTPEAALRMVEASQNLLLFNLNNEALHRRLER